MATLTFNSSTQKYDTTPTATPGQTGGVITNPTNTYNPPTDPNSAGPGYVGGYSAAGTGSGATPTQPVQSGASNNSYIDSTGKTVYGRLPSTPSSNVDPSSTLINNENPIEDPAKASADYQTSALSAAQGRINDINQVYAKQLSDELAAEKPEEENNVGRTNALSSLMGLSGSSAADARAGDTDRGNATIEKGITAKVSADKIAALNAIYDKIDSGAQDIYKAQLETNKTNQKAQYEAIAKNGLSNLQAIAQTTAGTGKTFDDWKTADGGDALNKIMTQTGQSEFQLRAAWNASLPANLQPTIHTSYTDDGSGGTVMHQVSFDPVTKKATSQDYKIAEPVSLFNGEDKPITAGNKLLVKQADGTYKDVAPHTADEIAAAKADTAYKQSETAKNLADAAKIRNDLNGSSDITVVSGNGIVAGVKVDPKISGDVEDVLQGRNTLYNIRQTMGRSNTSATYMKSIRDAIHQIDSKFDFVASDAGGKIVSSAYYQKSMSAIDSVLPNIDKVVDLSNQVSRVGVTGVDKLLQAGKVQIGDQKVSNFHEAQKLISDEIGLALGQGSVSDMKLQLGFDVTDPSVKPEIFASNMALVKDFIQNRKDGLNKQRYKSSVDTSSGFSVTDPSGAVHNFSDQKTLDAFKKEAGL